MLRRALDRLAVADLALRRLSSVYHSAPVGPVRDQPPFLNMVAEVETSMMPLELLAFCQRVEAGLGRSNKGDGGPRTIDIDLVYVDRLHGSWPGLELPHPRAHQRAFVLRPLLELSPDYRDPRDQTPLVDRLAQLSDQSLFRAGELAELVEREQPCD